MSNCELIKEPKEAKARVKFKVRFQLESSDTALKVAQWLRDNQQSALSATGCDYWMYKLADIIENK